MISKNIKNFTISSLFFVIGLYAMDEPPQKKFKAGDKQLGVPTLKFLAAQRILQSECISGEKIKSKLSSELITYLDAIKKEADKPKALPITLTSSNTFYYKGNTSQDSDLDYDSSTIRDLVASGKIDPNKVNRMGKTRLITAIMNRDEESALFLCEHTTNKQAKDIFKKNALHHAAITGMTGVAKKLLEAGLPINDQDINGLTPLMGAAMYKHEATLRLLLSYNPDINKRTLLGKKAEDLTSDQEIKNLLQKQQCKI